MKDRQKYTLSEDFPDGDLTKRIGPKEADYDHSIYPYIVHRDLIEAVNLSILLGRPLLLKGSALRRGHIPPQRPGAAERQRPNPPAASAQQPQ